ncbi:MAG TPA: ABC transporter ATP-binding protein [Actinomycetota bacterium]|nr:ABC transporter ATP-binding protein [Actinomycetota bacterium]
MAAPAVEVESLRKSYGRFEAVRGIDLTVSRGEVFALLGPNGAGKTTTIEILEGYRARTSGRVSVLGHDPARAGTELRRRIGIVLQSGGAEPYLSVAESIDLYRGYYPSPRPRDEILDVAGLGDVAHERVKRLSGGQQRRLDVALALAGDPELLFLDEPTTGFDPAARRNAWRVVDNLRALGKTIVLTTHYMDEAHALADRVAIVVAGRVVAHGDPSMLTRRDGATKVSFVAPAGVELPVAWAGERRGERVEITTTSPTKLLHDVTAWALERSIELDGLTVARPTLEDVYLELTAEERHEAAGGGDPDTARRRRRRR